MVRALLEGRKTQTRRIVKWKVRPESSGVNLSASSFIAGFYHTGVASSGYVLWSMAMGCWNDRTYPIHCPYGEVGDKLWVRETCWINGDQEENLVAYRADGEMPDHMKGEKWKPSIFMPRWASRITLEITEVRVQRLQEISEEDCRVEGCNGGHDSIPGYGFSATPREHYHDLFESINGKGSWDANSWVWAISFKVVKP
jgi:hypothetical protein